MFRALLRRCGVGNARTEELSSSVLSLAGWTPSRWGDGKHTAAGQPTWETHPELLGHEELAPGLNITEFAQRRRRLAARIPTRAVAVLSCADAISIAGIKWPYRQDSNFLYLTGIVQQAVAVIKQLGSASVDPGDHLFVLFVPTQSERDQWDGARMDCEVAVKMFGAHEAFPMSMLSRQLPWLVRDASAVLFDSDTSTEATSLQGEVKAMLVARALGKVQSLKPYVHSIRWRKSPAEIELMSRSARIAARGVKRCMEISHAGVHEQTLAATFEYHCKVSGAQHMAYPPISASGPDCGTIHYSRNDKVVKRDDLVLMDAGCELFGYASDVTRTWPVSGRFSGPQRELYDVVQDVHRRCLDLCLPGTSLRQLHNLSVRLLCDGLKRLGIVSVSEGALVNGTYKKFYPHMIGHYLGLDVHDTPTVPREIPLAANAVIALEPGLYIPDEEQYGHFRGIGVRIENDILITDNLPVVLSHDVPMDAREIEGIVGSNIVNSNDLPLLHQTSQHKNMEYESEYNSFQAGVAHS